MDALEEQLAQLKLMTSRTLSPRNLETNSDSSSSGGRGELVTTGAAENRTSPCQGSNHALLSSPLTVSHHKEDSSGTYSKKIGPAVPPKPWKRHQVAAATDLLPTDIRRKAQNPYSNMQMTLDNSVILDQQLEALEYHKKKIEQRSVVAAGIANRDNTTSAAAAGSVATLPRSTETDITTGSVKGTAASEIVPNVGGNYHLYSNVEQLEPMGITGKANPDAVVYSNIRYKPQHATVDKNDSAILTPNQNQIVYSNVGFGEQLPPPPPFEIPSAPASVSLTLDSNSLEYLQQTSEEDLPPPPSPVSSSYSELRRATDNFPQITQYSMYGRAENGQNRQPNEHYHAKHQTAEETANPVDSGPTSSSSAAGVMHYHSNHPQQIYANAHYQNIYRPYEPNSQVTGGGSTSSEYGYGYADLCQSLSAYESIYEPINPRPPSQLSSRSNYLLYNSYVNGSQMTPGGSLPRIKMASNSSLCSASSSVGGSGIPVRHDSDKLSPGHKEAEVEALTNLLVHSMDSDTDIDSYGICGKCSERILGEASGCTAMDRIYHIDCFTCSQCGLNLQGKPFYAFDGEPYCEEDYLNTLEKCSVCMKPILERILRATGKPYHPRCFCCVVCGKSLDGIPFTVDATNQNYCIEDFHKKFAPRCCVCQEPIMPEPGEEETVRVVALDRSFHVKCYKCEDCGLLLSSEAEGRGCYPLDDHVLCKSCNAKRVQALTNRMTTEL